jgi:hypothetical protein
MNMTWETKKLVSGTNHDYKKRMDFVPAPMGTDAI